MILRRLMRHVSEQNWTAVAIEFVIVVVGVFVGIQAQAWSVERGERRLERVYLERLLADLDLSITTTEQNRTRLNEYSDGQLLVVASLQNCALPVDRRDAFADGIADLGKVGPSVFVLNTMDEMLSAGHFSLIRNPEVRDVLNGLARDRGYQANVFEAIDSQLAPLVAVAAQRVVRTYGEHRTPFDPVAWDDLSLDFPALCQDIAFQGAVSQIRYLTDAGISLSGRALEKLRDARVVLASELGTLSASRPPAR